MAAKSKFAVCLLIVLSITVLLSGCSPEAKLQRYMKKMDDATDREQVELARKIAELDTADAREALLEACRDYSNEKLQLYVLKLYEGDVGEDIYLLYVDMLSEYSDGEDVSSYVIEQLGNYPSADTARVMLDAFADSEEPVTGDLKKAIIKMCAEPAVLDTVFTELSNDLNDESYEYDSYSIFLQDIISASFDKYPNDELYYTVMKKGMYFARYLPTPGYIPTNEEAYYFNLAVSKCQENDDFAGKALNAVFSEDEELNTAAIKLFVNQNQTGLSEKFHLFALLSYPAYDENSIEYSKRLSEILGAVQSELGKDIYDTFIASMIDTVNTAEDEVAYRAADVLLAFEHTYNTKVYLSAIAPNNDISAMDNRYKNDMMSMIYYGEDWGEDVNVLDAKQEGEQKWQETKGTDTDVALAESIVEYMAALYAAEYPEDSLENTSLFTVLYRYLFRSKNFYFELIEKGFEYIKENSEFEPYFSRLMVQTPVDYTDYVYTDAVIEGLYGSTKNPDWVAGDRIMIIEKSIASPDTDAYVYYYTRSSMLTDDTLAYSLHNLRYMITVTDKYTNAGYYAGGGRTIPAYRHDIVIKVIDMVTGKTKASKTIRGESLPYTITMYSSTTRYIGDADTSAADDYIKERLTALGQ